MKSLLTLTFTFISISCLLAINPVKGKIASEKVATIEKSSELIDKELDQLLEAAALIKAHELTHDEFTQNHSDIAAELNVASDVDTGMLEGSPNAPVGIPGFWWGFCFGIIGLIVVYVAMEDGEERKEQARNALYGCIASTLVSVLIYGVLIAIAAT